MTRQFDPATLEIAVPLDPGDYYMYKINATTKEVLWKSANAITVIGAVVPVYNGETYAVYGDSSLSGKATAVKTTDGTSWATIGPPGFSDGANGTPALAVSKADGSIWATHNWNYSNWYWKGGLYKFDGSSWSKKQDVLVGTHTEIGPMVMNNEGTAMFMGLGTWSPWAGQMQKRTGTDFATASTFTMTGTGEGIANLLVDGDTLWLLTRKNYLYSDHSNLATHGGLTLRKYNILNASFSEADFVLQGTAHFNMTSRPAFAPALAVYEGVAYVVFIDPEAFGHYYHSSNGWNEQYTNPKLTVMKYDGSWSLVGSAQFSPVVYKTTRAGYDTGNNIGGEIAPNTDTHDLYKGAICVGGGKVFVTATDSSDNGFIMQYNGSSWSTVTGNYGSGIRNPTMFYDNGKLKIMYSKADGTGMVMYLHTL